MSVPLARFVDAFNRRVASLMDHPLVGGRIRRSMTIVSYTGRHSGRTFSTPVAYRRTWTGAGSDTREYVSIDVVLPDAKTWWRNFTGAGEPLTVELPEGIRRGHAVARRGSRAQARVRVLLDPR